MKNTYARPPRRGSIDDMAGREARAARQRLKDADAVFKQLSNLPAETGDERNARLMKFAEFWRQVEQDHLIVKQVRRKRL